MNPVELYIESLEAEQLQITMYLHELMLQEFGMTCKLRFGIPFYDINRWIVYVKPLKMAGVELCFLHGKWMKDELDLLDTKGRKQVKGVTYLKLTDIDEHTLIATLQEAVKLDEEFKNMKRLPKLSQ